MYQLKDTQKCIPYTPYKIIDFEEIELMLQPCSRSPLIYYLALLHQSAYVNYVASMVWKLHVVECLLWGSLMAQLESYKLLCKEHNYIYDPRS